ncbi:hypothetical protein QFZ58_002029 [Streptomyces sp. B1I3]|nr:hypothetical protein [Streptomyces sp. B1I3]
MYAGTAPRNGLASIPTAEADDPCVVSFFIDNEDYDPRLPTLTVGHNTENQPIPDSTIAPDSVGPGLPRSDEAPCPRELSLTCFDTAQSQCSYATGHPSCNQAVTARSTNASAWCGSSPRCSSAPLSHRMRGSRRNQES